MEEASSLNQGTIVSWGGGGGAVLARCQGHGLQCWTDLGLGVRAALSEWPALLSLPCAQGWQVCQLPEASRGPGR